ncbi:bifunctional hydroxymethylpyrimidine kinase/phosphomethylpyrimidine kinase [Burkholderia thailandensis]|uniref:hydroxymethylpyrimidine kinase n=1 Tax=Burkholderia thailandensis TaxID=57975 RepID=A0AAW9CNE3_BURTH|nr:bifunctional hydroxymethylpyrimidine kinase/phosphomethylpyrimidine kinase [Burkholderia thailandensis]AHI67888.1 hydroxymethylpyrimidine/phosphomethylpyrimidine kinase [Burkholderia thailandensis H0587]AIP65244.1 phosphomethylpyrimidine kinase [Burkholderia thailandensis]AJY31344.1 hydroxymethylpyrimidine kinase/phosphomethylpyrimidine kinase [Burkholderia thailandensis 34]AOI54733.1 hydroxymethylpyrimidine/phosphomethylpyrimidine kinase [Burkholderia thailandensis]AOJ54955.1 hydroxymethyl
MIANVLTIAGTDPTGGAGIQADLKAFSAMRAYGMAAITAVVAQNTAGVRGFRALDPAFVADQIDAVFDDVAVHAVKIGMIATAPIAEAVAAALVRHRPAPVVLDPVMVAKSGDRLLDPDAVDAIRDKLVPIATLITPNLPEAGVLLGRGEPRTLAEMHAAAAELHTLGSRWVLLKGGHLPGERSVDVLRGPAAATVELSAPRVATKNDHGTGCTLSAAIAALLPRHSVEDSVCRAKAYLSDALAASGQLDVGHGHGPVHHFHALWN